MTGTLLDKYNKVLKKEKMNNIQRKNDNTLKKCIQHSYFDFWFDKSNV